MNIYNPDRQGLSCTDVLTGANAKSPSQLPNATNHRNLRCPFKYDDPEKQKELDSLVLEENTKRQIVCNQNSVEDSIVSDTIKDFWNDFTDPPEFLDTKLDLIPSQTPTVLSSYPNQTTLMPAYMQSPTTGAAYHLPQMACGGIMEPCLSQASAKGVQAESEYALMAKSTSMVYFVVVHGNVYLYNGKNYELQTADDVEGVILDLCRDDVTRIGKYSPIKNAYKLLTIDRRFRSPQEWIDAGKQYVTFQNGNLDLKSGNLLPHDPMVFTTFCVHANYLGPCCGVDTPIFDQVLLRASGGDAHFTERLLQMYGYVLTPDVRGKCGFLLQGVTNSGKSVLCNFLSSFFPEEKVAAISLHSVGERFSTAELEDAALCITPDLPSAPLSEKTAGMVKALSGNDLIQADRKYQNHTKFHFNGKFVMCTNHPLFTKNADPAFTDRIVVLPFLHSIPRSEWDSNLLEKLKLERNAVASKAIDAYFRLLRNNYIFTGNFILNSPATIGHSAQSQYLIPELVNQYVHQYYQPAADGRVFVSDAHVDFCARLGIHPDPASFGKLFIEAANRYFDAVHERKRRSSGGNPISCVVGLCHVADTNHQTQ